MRLRWKSGWHRLDQWRCKFGHCLGLHVAVLELPFVVGLEQHGADQADDCTLVRKYADDISPSFDLFLSLGPLCQRLMAPPLIMA